MTTPVRTHLRYYVRNLIAVEAEIYGPAVAIELTRARLLAMPGAGREAYWDRSALRHYIAIALESGDGKDDRIRAIDVAEGVLRSWEDEMSGAAPPSEKGPESMQ